MTGSEYVRINRYRSEDYRGRCDVSMNDGVVDILMEMPKSMIRVMQQACEAL